MLSNIQNCDRSEKNRKKSEKAFQQNPKASVHRGQTSAIQLFLHFNVFYDESSEHELTVSGSFFKTLSPHSCSKEKNALMGLNCEFSDKKNPPKLLYFSVKLIIDVFEYSKCFCLRVKSHIFLRN